MHFPAVEELGGETLEVAQRVQEELPTLVKPFDEGDVARLQEALSLVPDLASRNGEGGTSFTERLQSARAEFRAGAPTAR